MDYIDYIEESDTSYNNTINSSHTEEHILCYMCDYVLNIVCDHNELAKYKHSVIKVRCPKCNYLNYMVYYPEYHKKGKK